MKTGFTKGLCLAAAAACAALDALPAPAAMTTAAYREEPASFTWEIQWDGQMSAGSGETLSPFVGQGEAPQFWAPTLRFSRLRPDGRRVRLVIQARHVTRVQDLDLPQGPLYRGVFVLEGVLGDLGSWARLDRQQLPHLSTPKDTLDTFDVFWRVEAAQESGKVGRLIVQGGHGAAGRAKTPKQRKKPNEMQPARSRRTPASRAEVASPKR